MQPPPSPGRASCISPCAFTRDDDTCARPGHRQIIHGAYLAATIITLVAWIRGTGRIEPWLDFAAFYYLDWFGWIIICSTTFFAMAGHLKLFLAWWSARPQRRRQLVAICLASLWGFVASTGFIMPNFGVDIFPLPALVLPFFIIFLVYGILRAIR